MAIAKSYARIDSYGKLLVPVSLLEKIASECYIAETEYTEEGMSLSKLTPISKIELHSADEVKSVLMHQELSRDID